MRLQCKVLAGAVTVGLLLSGASASAITNGTPDQGAHPYVGMLQAYDADLVPIQVCTGALVSPTVFVTAAHCVLKPPASHVEVWFAEGPILPDIDYLLALFLDPNFTSSCNASPNFDGYPCFGDAGGTPHPHPDACFGCGHGLPSEVSHDVAVVTLDAPVPTRVVSRYADLPALDQVDSLENRTPVDLVGYGVQDQLKFPGNVSPKPPPFFRWSGSGQRMRARGELVSGNFAHSDEFVRISLNAAKDGGGLCFGDSGGPDLLGGTDTVLAVNSYVTNYNCAGVGYSARIDMPDVLPWIEGFIE